MRIQPFVPVALMMATLLGCFDPPELDDPLPTPNDLGPVDTWAELEDAGPVGDDGLGSGPDEGLDDDGADESGDGEPIRVDPGLAQVRITEILADPEGKDGGSDSPEFVEIVNPGPSPANLAGLTLVAASWPTLDADDLGLAEIELAVGGIVVVRRFATDTLSPELELAVVDGVIWTGFQHSGALRNTDGSVVLEAGGVVIDELVYGPDQATSSPGSGRSMCRAEPSDASWTDCDPTPGMMGSGEDPADPEAPLIPIGAIQIVEVSANPPGAALDEKYHEFVELINLSEDPIELGGCRIGDAIQFDAPGVDPLEVLAGDGGCGTPTCLAPGARAIIVGQSYIGPTGDALVLATDDTTIADGGLTNTEPVVLWRSDGELLSSHRVWADPAGDPIPTDEQPLHRIDPAGPDEPSNWVSGVPTPGL